jgi:hypothetical protein
MGKVLFERACYLHLLSNSEQGFPGRLISIRGWIECRALEVRIVVGTAGGEVHKLDVQVAE